MSSQPTPAFTPLDSADRGLAYAVSGREVSLRTVRCADRQNCVVAQFCLAITRSAIMRAMDNPVSEVFGLRGPSQVIRAIVSAITVVVRDNMAWARRFWQKAGGNQPVHIEVLSLPVNAYCEMEVVPVVPGTRWTKNSPGFRPAQAPTVCGSLHASEIAYRIVGSKRYRPPNLYAIALVIHGALLSRVVRAGATLARRFRPVLYGRFPFCSQLEGCAP